MRTTPQILVTKGNRAVQKYYTVQDVGKALSNADENSVVILQPGDYSLQPMNVPSSVFVLARPGAFLSWDRGFVTGAVENVVDLNVFGGIESLQDLSASLFFLQPPQGTTLKAENSDVSALDVNIRKLALSSGSESQGEAVTSGPVKLYYSDPDTPNDIRPIQELDNTSNGYQATLLKQEISSSKNIYAANENDIANPIDSETLTLFSEPRTVNLSSSGQTFTIQKNGAISPESITITSSLENEPEKPEWRVIDTDPSGIDVEIIDAETGQPLTFSDSISAPYSSEQTLQVRIEIGVVENNANLKSFTIRAQTANDTFDEFTVMVLEEGSDGFTVALTNENHTFPSQDVQGTVDNDDLQFGNTSAIVFQGAQEFQYDPQLSSNETWRFQEFTTDGGGDIEQVEPEGAMVVEINDATQEIRPVSFDGANVAAVKARIQIRDQRGQQRTFTRQITYSKAIPGNDSRQLVLTTDALVFRVANDGTPTPDVINFEILQQNIERAINWSTSDATVLQSTSNSGAELHFDDMVDDAVSVTAETQDNEFSDTVTIPKLREGQDAFTFVMSNENHTVTADESGVPVNLTGAQTDLFLFQGIQDITNESRVEFFADSIEGVSIVDGQGANIAEGQEIPKLGGNPPEFNVDSVGSGQLVATVRVAAEVDGEFVGSKVFTLSVARQGFAGDDAESLRLDAEGQTFKILKDGTVDPENITLIASASNLDESNIAWSSPDSNVNAVLDAQSGVQRTVNVNDLTNESAVVEIELNGQSDRVRLFKLREGDDSVAVILSNSNHTFQASRDGTVADFRPSGDCEIRVFQGITEIPYDDTDSSENHYRLINVDQENVKNTNYGVFEEQEGDYLIYKLGPPDGTVPNIEQEFTVDFTVQASVQEDTVELPQRISYSKSIEGIPGDPSTTVKVVPESQVFRKNKDGTFTPSSITISSQIDNFENLNDVDYAWEDESGSIATTKNITVEPSDLGEDNRETFRLTVTGDSSTQTNISKFDETTILVVEEGSDTINAFFSNENHTYPATTSGTLLTDITEGNSTGSVFEGATKLAFNQEATGFPASTGQFNIETLLVTGFLGAPDFSADGNDVNVDLSSMTFDDASGSIGIQFNVRRQDGSTQEINRQISFSKSLEGTRGDDASLVKLSATSQIFRVTKDSNLEPPSIQLSATTQGASDVDETSWGAFSSDGTEITSSLLTFNPAGDIATINNDDFTVGYATISATDNNDSNIFDEITVARVREGSDAITIILTNESHTYPADADGTLSGADIQDGNCEVIVYRGATRLSRGSSGFEINNVSISGFIDGGFDGSTFEPSGFNASSNDIATVTFDVEITAPGETNGATFERQITYTRSRAGSPGSPGNPGPGVVYRGEFSTSTEYVYVVNAEDVVTRRDVVLASDDEYYLSTAEGPSGSTGWDDPTTATDQWESYGQTFDSIATGLLLTQDATITRTLTMGDSGSDSGLIRSAIEPVAGKPLYEIGNLVSDNDEGIVYRDQSGNDVFKILSQESSAIIQNANITDLNVTGTLEMNGGEITNTNQDFIISSGGYALQQAVFSTGIPLGVNPPNASRAFKFIDTIENLTGGFIYSTRVDDDNINKLGVVSTSSGPANKYDGIVSIEAQGSEPEIALSTYEFNEISRFKTIHSSLFMRHDKITHRVNGVISDSEILIDQNNIALQCHDSITLKTENASIPNNSSLSGNIFLSAYRRVTLKSEFESIRIQPNSSSSGSSKPSPPSIKIQNGFLVFENPRMDGLGASAYANAAGLENGQAAIAAIQKSDGNVNLLWVEQKTDGSHRVHTTF